MEDKYRQYLQYDWNNSEEWKLYFNNLFPVPPSSRIDYYKKKFYKLKIDPDFDINYYPNVNHNQRVNPVIYGELGYLSLIVLTMIFSTYNSLKIAFPYFVYRIYKDIGSVQFTVPFLQNLLINEYFHTFVYNVIFVFEGINSIILSSPFAVLYFVDISACLKEIYPSNEFLIKITRNRNKIIENKSLLEIAEIILIIIGVVIKTNSFFFILIYIQYIKFKNSVSTPMSNSFRYLKQKADEINSNQNTPDVVKTIIGGIIKISSFFNSTGQNIQMGPVGVSVCSII